MKYLKIKILSLGMIVYLFEIGHPILAATCSDLFNRKFSSIELEYLKAETVLNAYFQSTTPDFKKVQTILSSLEKLDTSLLQTQRKLPSLQRLIQYWAEILSTPSLNKNSSLEHLKSISTKLRFLNSPAIRNFLSNDLQSRVGQSTWIFNRAIWNEDLTLEMKIETITEKLLQDRSSFENFDQITLLPNRNDIQINVVNSDFMLMNSEAKITTIECDGGLCGSHINKFIESNIGDSLKNKSLKDGEVLSINNFILVVDDQKLPLHVLVKNALLKTEALGFKSVVIPALRSGYAFGAVEISFEEISSEIARGISLFLKDSTGVLNEINVAVKNNKVLADQIQRTLSQKKMIRERSLRHDLRPVELSGTGFTMFPSKNRSKIDTSTSPIYRTMLVPWNLSMMMETHRPVHIGQLENKKAFSKKTVSVLNMPIKFPDSDFKIPRELIQFKEFLQKMIDHEAEVNPEMNDFYAYITIDQNLVKKGTTHRRGGIHIDGVQGIRYPVKMTPEHTYSACDSVGTVFYDQPFDLRGFDANKNHVHAELERQARSENRIITKDFELYFWDSYSVHEAGVADKDIVRTFVRVEFSKKKYDGYGDTQSPLFEYNWPRVHRPIPLNLDDTPISSSGKLEALSSSLDKKGYFPEISDINAWAPHTIKNVRAYLNDNLGIETVSFAEKDSSRFLLAVGEGKEALLLAEKLGWKVETQIQKREGFHRVFKAIDPNGKPGFVIIRVNGEDRVLHLQSLLKLAGTTTKNIHTVGQTRSWRAEYKKTFDQLGYIPDLVVYGFANTAIDATLLRNGFKNGRHFARLKKNFKQKKSAVSGDSSSDLDGLSMQVLELADGRKVWFLHCMFGDLARDLIGAVADHGAKNITFIGSAGSLDPDIRFGSMLTPVSIYRSTTGEHEILNLPEIPGIPKEGHYMRVPTPNVGTRAWVDNTIEKGVNIVESELGHVIQEIDSHPGIIFRVALVISEVAKGPNHRDMTEWGYSDLRALMPDLNKVIDDSLGTSNPSIFVIRSYNTVPLMPSETSPSSNSHNH